MEVGIDDVPGHGGGQEPDRLLGARDPHQRLVVLEAHPGCPPPGAGGAEAAAAYMRPLIQGLLAYGHIQCMLGFLQTQSAVIPLVMCSVSPLAPHVGITYLLVHPTGLGFTGATLSAQCEREKGRLRRVTPTELPGGGLQRERGEREAPEGLSLTGISNPHPMGEVRERVKDMRGDSERWSVTDPTERERERHRSPSKEAFSLTSAFASISSSFTVADGCNSTSSYGFQGHQRSASPTRVHLAGASSASDHLSIAGRPTSPVAVSYNNLQIVKRPVPWRPYDVKRVCAR